MIPNKNEFEQIYLSKSIPQVCEYFKVKKSTIHNWAKLFGLSKIGKVNTTTFLTQAKEKWKDKYDYTNTKYINKNTKIQYVCPEHGEQEQFPYLHLKNGCQYCSGRGISKHTKETFIAKANQVHEKFYNYSKVKFNNIHDKVTIICPIHGEFSQKACNHINNKQGCHKCKGGVNLTHEEFIEKCREIHGDKFAYISKYTKSHETIKINCPIHGEFEQLSYMHLQTKHSCPICVAELTVSEGECELREYIRTLHDNVIGNNRTVLAPREIDIYLPDKHLGIEYHGMYWHTEAVVGKNYHKDKLSLAEEKNVRLIQVYEHEWKHKKTIVKSRIKGILGLNDRIYARKCKIVTLKHHEKNEFLERTHIQGKDSSTWMYGLVYKDRLVAVMTFGKARFGAKGYELMRYSSELGVNVIGGAGKLLKHFKKNTQIVSYADRRWSQGQLYEKLGFKLDGITNIGYHYYNVNNKTLHNRMNFSKNKIKKMNGYAENLSAYDIMRLNGYDRIWDCGHLRYVLI